MTWSVGCPMLGGGTRGGGKNCLRLNRHKFKEQVQQNRGGWRHPREAGERCIIKQPWMAFGGAGRASVAPLGGPGSLGAVRGVCWNSFQPTTGGKAKGALKLFGPDEGLETSSFPSLDNASTSCTAKYEEQMCLNDDVCSSIVIF